MKSIGAGTTFSSGPALKSATGTGPGAATIRSVLVRLLLASGPLAVRVTE